MEQPVRQGGGHDLVAEDPAPSSKPLFEVSIVEAWP